DLRAPGRPWRPGRRRDRLRRRDDRPLRHQLRRVAPVVARIKDASVREAVEAADMVEVVSARTQLRRAGARYTGLCPFHDEKTPSFSVNPADKLFYCFGCGKGGDLITFVRETEQLDFAEAVEWLAERYRVTLEYEESSPELDAERNRRERLLALLEQATAYYERCLWDSPRGESARTYLQSRALGEETCREYRLGLAPGGQSLARKAKEKGFSAAELSAAGLVNRRGNDYFSGRLLFPLADARGRVRGFQARKLREDDPLRAKYVNSPEGELFRKGSLLYGLDRARAAIAKQERAVVVEGNTDVLARFEDSPERQDAVRLAADRLDRPKETQAGLAPGRRGSATGEISPRLLEAGARLELEALAGVAAHPELHELLAGLAPEHFDSELHRRARGHLLEPGEADEELVPLLAELDARAAEAGIDEETTKELLLKLRERQLRRELEHADLDRTKELQEQLAKIRATAASLS